MALDDRVRELAAEVEPPDAPAAEAAWDLHRRLLKPPGSLGRLETLGASLAGMAGACPPPVPENPAVVICAGDHGVHAQDVSPWPREVTAVMVENICAGGAAVNALARTVGARVSVLDVGVVSDLDRHPLLRGAKVRPGTDDLSRGQAMSREEASRAILAGAGVAEELVESGGVDLLVTGDMGIGNTTPAACLVAAFTGRQAREVTGRGTGIDDATLERKTTTVAMALERHDPHPGDPLGVLANLGGLEHAALVGIILMGAIYGVPVLLDGVVSNSAALVARALAPHSTGYLLAGHLSVEPGSRLALEELGLVGLLDLELRLGEGTGGLLAVPLVQAAARVMGETKTLEEAGLA